MSIFGSIMSKIFGSHAQAAPAAPAPDAPAAAPAAGAGTAPASVPASPATGGGAPSQVVDVGAVLTEMASKQDQELNWKESIVDLLKLLGMDSSLTARKTLADELHYDGDKNDTATMNVWLIKQVMKKLAENGGKLPADLKH